MCYLRIAENVLGTTSRVRFSKLMKELEGISPKPLTDTLAVLQEEGFVGQEASPEIPLKVEYFLTDTAGNSGMRSSRSSSGP